MVYLVMVCICVSACLPVCLYICLSAGNDLKYKQNDYRVAWSHKMPCL